MSLPGLLQIVVFLVILLALTKPLGLYMAQVFSGERTVLSPVLRPVEGLVYRLSGVDPAVEQGWVAYTFAMLLFSLAGMLVLYVIQRLQGFLPFNPQALGEVAPDLAFNTAASFVANTNWQAYSGESTMSYFSQMVGLAFHNFVSAATGIAIAIALTRGLARRSSRAIGFIPLLNMKLGEVIFGGVGAGLYGMLVYVILLSSPPGSWSVARRSTWARRLNRSR